MDWVLAYNTQRGSLWPGDQALPAAESDVNRCVFRRRIFTRFFARAFAATPFA
jgi:hypothetical protein